MKRRLILLLMLSQMAFLCEERWEGALEGNDPPELSFKLTEMPGASLKTIDDERYFQTVTDSMKLSLKARPFYAFALGFSDDNLQALGFDILEGSGSVRQEGVEVASEGELLLNGSGELSLSYFPDAVGEHVLELYAEDAFRARTTISLELTVFENLPPVAALALEPKGTLNEGHYVLDAGASYDTDARWGGYPALYRFFVDGEDVGTSAHPFLEHIFQASGKYEVAVEVTDNEGARSERATAITDIQL